MTTHWQAPKAMRLQMKVSPTSDLNAQTRMSRTTHVISGLLAGKTNHINARILMLVFNLMYFLFIYQHQSECVSQSLQRRLSAEFMAPVRRFSDGL